MLAVECRSRCKMQTMESPTSTLIVVIIIVVAHNNANSLL